MQQLKSTNQFKVGGMNFHICKTDAVSCAGIKVQAGFSCGLCDFACGVKDSMRTHFSKDHKGINPWDYSTDAAVQRPFSGQHRKYVILPAQYLPDDSDEPAPEGRWEAAYNTATSQFRAEHSSPGGFQANIRNMSGFSAVLRWDNMVEGLQLQLLRDNAAMPGPRDSFKAIVLVAGIYLQRISHMIGNAPEPLRWGIKEYRVHSSLLPPLMAVQERLHDILGPQLHKGLCKRAGQACHLPYEEHLC